MANKLTAIIIFIICINIAGSIMFFLVVTPNGDNVFDNSHTKGYQYQDDVGGFSDEFVDDMGEDISPSGSVEDSGDQVYRVIDTLNLGFMAKFFNLIGKFLFGIVDYFEAILGDLMTDDMHRILFGERGNFGILKTAMSIIYIIGGISLLTGKDVTR